MALEKASLFFRKAVGYDTMVFDILSPHLNNGKVLSVGCGEGRVESLLQRKRGIDIVGAEVTLYKNQKIQIEMIDGEKLPFPDKSFETTIFVYMLHHTENIDTLLAEARRVTKGTILILDHTYTNPLSKGLLKLYDYGANIFSGMPIPFNFLKIREWKSLFKKFNLDVEEATIPSALNVFFKLTVRPTTG